MGRDMISESSVREKLLEVVQDKISLEQFENWLSASSWNMHRDSSQEAIEIASSIHLLLSERDDRVLSETDLRKQLFSLVGKSPDVQYRIDENLNVFAQLKPWRSRISSVPVVRKVALQLS
jgi:hypothetical protein